MANDMSHARDSADRDISVSLNHFACLNRRLALTRTPPGAASTVCILGAWG